MDMLKNYECLLSLNFDIFISFMECKHDTHLISLNVSGKHLRKSTCIFYRYGIKMKFDKLSFEDTVTKKILATYFNVLQYSHSTIWKYNIISKQIACC